MASATKSTQESGEDPKCTPCPQSKNGLGVVTKGQSDIYVQTFAR